MDIQFDEENNLVRRVGRQKTTTIVNLCIKLSGGLIRTKSQANIFLMVLIVLLFITMYVLLTSIGNDSNISTRQIDDAI